jgi:hypothetical protein
LASICEKGMTWLSPADASSILAGVVELGPDRETLCRRVAGASEGGQVRHLLVLQYLLVRVKRWRHRLFERRRRVGVRRSGRRVSRPVGV